MPAQQSHEKAIVVGAVRLDVDALEGLIEAMKGLVGETGHSIYLSLTKGESKYTFSSIEELREQLAILPASVRDVYLSVSAGKGNSEKGILVHGSPLFSTDVKASGADKNWCIGAIAVINANMKQHRTWYSFIKASFFPWIALVGIVTAVTIQAVSTGEIFQSMFGSLSDPSAGKLAVVSISFLFLGFFWNILFPQWRLILKSQTNWLRSRAPEIGSAGVILSLLLAFILALL